MSDYKREKIVFCDLDSVWSHIENYSNILIVSGNGPEQDIAASLYSSISSNVDAKVNTLSIPAGESAKSEKVLNILWEMFHRFGVDRSSLVVSVGGGSVSDVVGFACSTFMRGVDMYSVPTTLLAMIDASIGGKRAINTSYAKNILGSFYCSKKVFIDSSILKSLPAEEFINGMCELLKMSFVFGGKLFDRLSELDINNERDIQFAIKECINLKQDIVSADYFDNCGMRIKLNYGHTLAHALESLDGYNNLSHGLAVAVGMDFAANIFASSDVAKSQDILFSKFNIKDQVNNIKSQLSKDNVFRIVQFLKNDKKVKNTSINFVYLEKIGICKTQEIQFENLELSLIKYIENV